MPLSAEDGSTLNNAPLRLYLEFDAERHRQVLLEVLHKLLPSGLTALNVLGMATRWLPLISLPANCLPPADPSKMARLQGWSPFPDHYLATGDPLWKVMTDFLPMDDFRATKPWREGLHPRNLRQQRSARERGAPARAAAESRCGAACREGRRR